MWRTLNLMYLTLLPAIGGITVTQTVADSLVFRASQVVLVVKNPLANEGDTGDAGSVPG